MMTRTVLLVPLGPLFAALLSGCPTDTGQSCGTNPPRTRIIELTPEQYASWAMGIPPPTSTGDEPTTDGDTSGTDGASTGGASTGGGGTGGGGTGGASTGGGTGGVMLDEQELCTLICEWQKSTEIGDLISCSVGEPDAEGDVIVECVEPVLCLGGRLHACIRSRGALATGSRAAAWLARAVHDEAASVSAFVSLGRELAAHGAPAELLAALDAAALDEVRHAEAVRGLADRLGVPVPTLEVGEPPVRDLLAIAVENAVEGCVGETWAALSAAHQARFAADAEVRAIFAAIAADEARHAELAWALDAWLIGQLHPAERALVAAARRRATLRLAAVLEDTPDDAGLAALGLPDRSTARRLFAGLDGALWSQAA